jgi:hypothetical protein
MTKGSALLSIEMAAAPGNPPGPSLGQARERRLRVALLVTKGSSARVPVQPLIRRLEASGCVEAFPAEESVPPDGPVGDPFRLRERIPKVRADAWLLLAGPRRGPRRLAPSPVLHGKPVGILQGLEPGGGHRRGAASNPSAPWIVAAMAKDVFLEPTDHWADTLKAGGRRAVDLRADRARRSDLVSALRAGPSVVLYAGHGRTRGWGGYQTLRWSHLESVAGSPERSVGVVVAFACDTLSRSRSRIPFGSRLVDSGFARAYLAPAQPIRTSDAEQLAEVVVGLLAGRTHASLTHLMRRVDAAVSSLPAAHRAWRRFRLVGDPTVSLAPPLPEGVT